MEYTEDHIALAAEYALGTLEAEERAQVEAMMAVDAEYATIVQAWEFRLGVLNQMVGSVEPNPDLWEKIRTAIGLKDEPQAPPALLEEPPAVMPPPISPPPISPPPISEAANDEMRLPPALLATAAAPAPEPEPTEADVAAVTQLAGRVRAYRSLAVAMTAIAAALLAIIGVQVYSPGLLPGLGGRPAAQVAEVKTPPTAAAAPTPSAQYVALLQGAAGGPAFILTVDEATKNFTVRKVGAPPIDPSKNYELWLISDKLQGKPRSLGVIGVSDFVASPALAGYASDLINNATYAVTVEQAGGSPDGVPHSQVAFIGKLIQTVPPPSASPTPAPSPTQKQ